MAIEIEQPFGDDANDLPLETYILDLEACLLEILPASSSGDLVRKSQARYAADDAAGGLIGDAKGTSAPLEKSFTLSRPAPVSSSSSAQDFVADSGPRGGQRGGPGGGAGARADPAAVRIPAPAPDPVGSQAAEDPGMTAYKRLLEESNKEVLSLMPSSLAFYSSRYKAPGKGAE